jgi:hypothetical protein
MEGDLVRARNSEGRQWISSLTREDSGSGACEVFYVRTAQRVAPARPPALATGS